jgi:hypothetical protein
MEQQPRKQHDLTKRALLICDVTRLRRDVRSDLDCMLGLMCGECGMEQGKPLECQPDVSDGFAEISGMVTNAEAREKHPEIDASCRSSVQIPSRRDFAASAT